ncbi:MAG: cysteine hydrolase family protein [Pseudolabrys sp.]
MSKLLSTVADQVRPAHTALLIVDMQNDFCAEDGYLRKMRSYDVGFAGDVAARIARLADAARAAGAAVIWIKSYYDFKYLTLAHIAKRREEGCCLEGTWGAELFRLEPAAEEPVVIKHHFSGFKSTRLDDLLRARGIRTLLMTGVATNVCVDSTLRDGFFLGYHIVLVEDCVGSNNEAGHRGTLATVRANIGTVASSDEVIGLLADNRSGLSDRGQLA